MKDINFNILGISAFCNDTSATLLQNGEIIAAVQEERFTRKKFDNSFPINSINYCLKEATIDISKINLIAFTGNPDKKSGISLSTSSKIETIKKLLENTLGYTADIYIPSSEHIQTSSAFYPSPFKEAAILTIDGLSSNLPIILAQGKKNSIEIISSIPAPNSPGFLYSAFTQFCGFRPNSDEYKLMGLAPFGKPIYINTIINNLIQTSNTYPFKLNQEYFDFNPLNFLTNKKFHNLFGISPRKKEDLLKRPYIDIASSIQATIEMIIINLAKHLKSKTKNTNLCMSGEVALNCVANGKLLKEKVFEDIWIQPASSNAGKSLGIALNAWYSYKNKPRNSRITGNFQKGSFLGPYFDNKVIEKFLITNNIPHKKLKEQELPEIVADLIADQNIIGWFQGRMEFGPRALGSRSILADPRNEKMQSIINHKIKFRESFRPFAPSILREKITKYFNLDRDYPYMLFALPLKKSMQFKEITTNKFTNLEKVKEKRSEIPAITHIDYTARIQTVDKEHNKLFYALINTFNKKHGCPLLINTSFNTKEEPIVCTPHDAYNCFIKTNMDYLILESFLISKKDII